MKIAEIKTELKPHQLRVVNRMKAQPGLVVAHGMGSGKAQPLYARVLTPTGWTTNGELRVGDMVIGLGGSATKVLGVYPQGLRAIYQVMMSDGATTTCCDEHLWEVNTAKRIMRGNPARVLPLNEIKKRLADKHGNRQHFIPMVRPVQFNMRRPPLHPYVLGVLLGDGSIVQGTPSLSSADKNLVHRVQELVPEGITVRKNKGSKYGYYLSSGRNSKHNVLTSTLRSLGLWGKHSWEKSIPARYLYAPVSQRLELLQGLMDTDGYGSKNSAQFYSTSRELSEGVRELVMSLGGCASIKTKTDTRYFYKGKHRVGRVVYIVNIRLLSGMPMFWLPRKLKKLGVRTKYFPTRSIASVKYLGEVEVQCIKVAAEDQLYVTDDYIVTHNTLTAIAAANELGGNTEVRVPASLRSNFQKEIKKHVVGKPTTDFNIDSIQRAALGGKIAPSKTLIVDEAHRLRDPASKARAAIRGADAEKRMLLTGTSLYNRPYDLASIVNVAAGNNVFPGAQADFDKRYIGERKIDPSWFARTFRGVQPGTIPELKKKDELGKILQQWVDFHENTTEGFPTRRDELVPTTMSSQQREHYKSLMGDAPAWVRYKIKHGLPPNKQESKDLNAFLSGVRQVSLSPGGFEEGMTPEMAAEQSPKLQAAHQRLMARIEKDPEHRALVYSNFLESGLHPYETMLKNKNVPYGKFTGELGRSERDQMVKDYNTGKLRALLLSSAGGEGLDLKGTRQIQVLEPHFNKEKLEQVIARGIRYKSHEHLPPAQRTVDVEHYQSQLPEPGKLRKLFGAKRPGAVDEYLSTLSSQKDELNQQVRELLRAQPKTASLAELTSIYGDLVSSCGSLHPCR